MTTFRSVSSLERELRDKQRALRKLRTEVDQAVKEKRELERELHDKREAWKHLPADYAEALVDLYNIAHHGIDLADNIGSNPNKATTRSPTSSPVAYSRWRREITRLEKAATWISTDLEKIIKGEPLEPRTKPEGEAA